ncbi:unnamed protein product [Polarella glacialis]|uniref:Uncharacterized protein n=1 Tax=Polarella glacialis TaxID=89957 RepID=A0A813D9B6_POLGL|nr:unnamed protein product [Polarella glacialis]
MDLGASSSLKEVLGAVGLNFLVAQLVDRLAVKQEIEQSALGLDVTVKTLMGTNTFVLPFDGSVTEVPGAAGGKNLQSSRWEPSSQGRPPRLVTRQAVTGTLNSDDAVIFETMRSLDGADTLYEHVRVLKSGSPVAQGRRVLRRLT